MTVGVLTSSRADFGIYIPLLRELKGDPFFDLEIIAFGTHLSQDHGYTLDEIKGYNFAEIRTINCIPGGDSPSAISMSVGEIAKLFSAFWNDHKYDLVICLGDRFEMFAAVAALSPFGRKIAHIHAGETTLGAIDNAYRHSISLFSSLLFVSTEKYKVRAQSVVEDSTPVFNVGALSVDNLTSVDLYSIDEFEEKYEIDLSKPTILSTYHPETVSHQDNEQNIHQLLMAFKELLVRYQVIITLPNIDTTGATVRSIILEFSEFNPSLIVVESFGMRGYLSCMKHCSFLLGNTSSGFVEAAFFPKYVINLGSRQEGRLKSDHIINSKIEKEEILQSVRWVERQGEPKKEYLYGEGDSSKKIVSILKQL